MCDAASELTFAAMSSAIALAKISIVESAVDMRAPSIAKGSEVDSIAPRLRRFADRFSRRVPQSVARELNT
jgi:hypothetical protein